MIQVKTRRVGEPPKIENRLDSQKKEQKKLSDQKPRSSLGLVPDQQQDGRRLSVVGVGAPGTGRRSSIRRRSSIYLNPGQVNQDVMPEKSILRRDSVMNK